MNCRVAVAVAAIFITTLLLLGKAQAEPIHLEVNPQKSQIKATVADPLARFRESGEIEATLRIISGGVDDGEVSFNYTDFGVRVPRLLFALPAGSEVTVHFHVVAERPNSAARKPQAQSSPG